MFGGFVTRFHKVAYRLLSTTTISKNISRISSFEQQANINNNKQLNDKYFLERYEQKKLLHYARQARDELVPLGGLVDLNDVFINNEVNLNYTKVYGFDYDYTLANYTENLPRAIYRVLRHILIKQFSYPKGLESVDFDQDFAIRGLHYDMQTGWLMKIDAFSNVQMNTIYFGREPLKDIQELHKIHKGVHISQEYLNDMYQLNDLFSIPEACLLADVIQYFNEHNVKFHPRYLVEDIRAAARIIHLGASRDGIGGQLHHMIINNIPEFLEKAPRLVAYLEKLRAQGKKLFLLTNSSFAFVDKGLSYITGNADWRSLFDVIICAADKPTFYITRRPFRRVSTPTWSIVDKFEEGNVYQGGNMMDFSKFTGWQGSSIMYIGDHVYSDLVSPTLHQGWRTGCVIRELSTEISIRNLPTSRFSLSWLLNLELLIREAQVASIDQQHREKLQLLLNEWRSERKELRTLLKRVFNPQFGSVFRTHHNPTFFANKIRKFADLYTSNIENFNNYPLDYIFYPERAYLPHEGLVEIFLDQKQ
ncbi:4659_t:CDS:10 [Ambispora gerdemannii]|uniref:4659_t:CDS:1 n=1 Tax=Ambispora gerdemannii TaxID=144530 RepID=A0A9N8ZSQ2_9GLOM|nr:4659_t:CDS:10 [Ambispora gerdemannii]